MGSSGDNDGMEFQNTDEDILNCPSSGMNTNPFFASAWDPVVSLSQHESFGGSSIVSQSGFTNSPYTVMLGNQGGISSTSHLAHYPSDSSFVEMVQKFPCFGSGPYAEMAGSLGLRQCGQIVNTGCPSSYTSNTEGNDERNMANGAQSQMHQQFSEEAVIKALPNGKRRKRGAESTTPLNTDMKTEGEQKKDSPGETSDVPSEQDDKRPKIEENLGVNLKGKQAAKQSKENSHSGDGSKENYIHVRARRGQATNSHSLAERVRREKISERMRLLQELVPGCNKITGKAVMLDEIINYVQSLQQQVEFLSMKLATVNPELNIDIERILSKEILQSRGGNPSSVFGFSPGINSLPYSHGSFQAGIPIIPNTNPQFPPASQAILDSELQNLFRMGFDSNSAMDCLGPTGRLKPEL